MLFQVNSNQLKSLPPELGLLTNLKELSVRHSRQMDIDLTLRLVLFRSPTTSSRRCLQKSASCDSSNGSTCEIRIEWIVI
jgi:Leucine-rich repeat (LRR) protein